MSTFCIFSLQSNQRTFIRVSLKRKTFSELFGTDRFFYILYTSLVAQGYSTQKDLRLETHDWFRIIFGIDLNLSVHFAFFLLKSRHFRDTCINFGTTMCLGPRTSVIESGLDRPTGSTISCTRSYFEELLYE